MNPIKRFLKNDQRTWDLVFDSCQQAKKINAKRFWLTTIAHGLLLVVFCLFWHFAQPKPIKGNIINASYLLFSLPFGFIFLLLSWSLSVKEIIKSEESKNKSHDSNS